MYRIYDVINDTLLEQGVSNNKNETAWTALNFLTEDWNEKDFDVMFSHHESIYSVLNAYGYQIIKE